MTNIVKIDESNVWYECGCLKCGTTVKVLPEQEYRPPATWQRIMYRDTTDNYSSCNRLGYICPNCYAKLQTDVLTKSGISGTGERL